MFNIFFTRDFIKFYVELLALIYCEVNLKHSVQSIFIVFSTHTVCSIVYSHAFSTIHSGDWSGTIVRECVIISWCTGTYNTLTECTVQCVLVLCSALYSVLHTANCMVFTLKYLVPETTECVPFYWMYCTVLNSQQTSHCVLICAKQTIRPNTVNVHTAGSSTVQCTVQCSAVQCSLMCNMYSVYCSCKECTVCSDN